MSSASPATRGAVTSVGSSLRTRAGEPALALTIVAWAVASWLVALAHTHLSAMAGLGLLDALPVTFYVALALLVVGFARAVTRPAPQPALLGLNVLATTVVLHGTASLLYNVPRYPWTYKHIGVTELLASHGSLDRGIDVYNNWPGFFGLMAWLHRATGVPIYDLATWAPLFFALAGVVAVHFALRAVTVDPRLVWAACWLFVLTNWIGQNYYAPQAIAFPMSLVVIGLVLRVPPRPTAPRYTPRLLCRLQERLRAWNVSTRPLVALGVHASVAARPTRVDGQQTYARHRRTMSVASASSATMRWSTWFAPTGSGAPAQTGLLLALAGAVFVAIVVTHQLSPLLVLVQLIALALLSRQVPIWFVATLGLVEAAWVATTLPFLLSHYQLFDFSPMATPPSGLSATQGLPGVMWAFASKPALVAAIALLAILGGVLACRARRLPAVVPILAAAPMVIVAVQQYGGEAPLRVYMFSLPWLCLLAADLLVAARRLIAVPAGALAVLSCGVVLSGLFLLAHFGAEQKNYVTRDDVAIATWFERHAPPGSVVTPVVPAWPVFPTGRYPKFVDNGEQGEGLIQMPQFVGHRLGTIDIPRLRRFFAQRFGTRHFLVVTGMQIRLARLYRAVPEGSFAGLRSALASQPDFRLVYATGNSYVFEYLPQGSSGTGGSA